MKVVINTCFGGFGLSPFCVVEVARRMGIEVFAEKTSNSFTNYWTSKDVPEILKKDFFRLNTDEQIEYNKQYEKYAFKLLENRDEKKLRTNPFLIAVVEEFGSKKCSGSCSELKVVEIPDGIIWDIDEYDGREHIEERHRTWY